MTRKLGSLSFLLPPLLVSVFPILSFYLSNTDQLSPVFLKNILPFALLASITFTLFVLLIFKNKSKASLISAISLFIFYSYGHLSRSFDSKLFLRLHNGVVIGPDKVLLPLLALIYFFFLVSMIKSKRPLNRLVVHLSLILLVLVTYLSVSILFFQPKTSLSDTQTPTSSSVATQTDAPDIYYIVLDGFAREDVLKEIYHYDNSSFTDSLKNMGFFVADKARANYIQTYLSLPSSLNSTYLDSLPEKYGPDSPDERAAIDLVLNNEVVRKVKASGYTVINFATWWGGTNESFPADLTYSQDKSFQLAGLNIATSETNMVFLQTTLLSPVIKEVWGQAWAGKILYTMQKLPDIPYLPQRKFVFAHILSPHPPFLFQANGSLLTGPGVKTADENISRRPLYLNQLTFIGNQILPVIQKILKNSPRPPIIILQSDHGPGSIFGENKNWLSNYSDTALFERTGILYAVYFPDHDYQDLYQTITPVNTYRIIFNKYFHENLDLLPDKTYYTDYGARYKFTDVTDQGLHP